MSDSCEPAAPPFSLYDEGERTSSRLLALFVTVCLLWGLTWIPLKIGVTAVAPLVFAVLRFSVAGTILLAIGRLSGRVMPDRRDVPRFLATGLFANAAIYGFLFWGLTQVSSGVAAVVNLSLIPVGLLVTATLMGEESLSRTKIAATFIGVVGLAVLYSADVRDASTMRALGIGAIALGTAIYCLGVVLSRQLLRRYPAIVVSGWTQVIGATTLFLVVLVADPSSLESVRRIREPRVLGSWAFLVVFGSVIAFTGYMKLTKEWTPSKAGAYAFVSPAIALLAGVIVLGEELTVTELVGSSLMLVGAVVSLRATSFRATRRSTARPAARDTNAGMEAARTLQINRHSGADSSA